MRRAVNHGSVTRLAKPAASASTVTCGGVEQARELLDRSSYAEDSAPIEVLLSGAGTFAKAVGANSSDSTFERNRQLAAAISQRIETRLPGRVRQLVVRVTAGTVVLEGECATYYTKQLAQHAALGILEDEHLENAIVVTVGR